MQIVKPPSDRRYALSMRAIRAAVNILPAAVRARVDRLLVVDHAVGPERFEYDAETKRAEFACLGEPEDLEARDQALRDLLRGFARIDAGASFGTRLTDAERAAFEPFVDRWYSTCAEVMAKHP